MMTSSSDDPLRSKESLYPPSKATTSRRMDVENAAHHNQASTTTGAAAANVVSGPRSKYYAGPPGPDSAFGTAPMGVIGRDRPREVIRIERDYADGELCQFHPTFPLELEGRISPIVFSETINDINVIIIQANSPLWACIDNTLAVMSLYTTPWLLGSKYKREIKRLKARIDQANKDDFNPAGLSILYPTRTAFLFLELEYY